MRIGICLSLLVLMAAAPAARSQDYQLYGSVEGYATYHYLPDADSSHLLSGEAAVVANHRLGYRHGEIVARHEIAVAEDDALRHTIREAYLAINPTEWLSVYAGRQRLNWGVGFTFAPSDSLHPAPLASAEAVIEDGGELGFTGLSGLLTAGANATVSAAVSGDHAWGAAEDKFYQGLTYAAGLSGFLPPLELWISTVYREDETLRPGAGVSVSAGPMVLYGEGAIELLNTYDYPAGTASGVPSFASPDAFEPYAIGAAGLETTIAVAAVDLNVTGEYLYYGPGYTDEQADLALATVAGPEVPSQIPVQLPPLLRRHYALAAVHTDFAGYASASFLAFVNLEDLSGALHGRGTLIFLQGIDLWLEGAWFFGKTETEFGTYPPDSALPGRLQVRLGATAHF